MQLRRLDVANIRSFERGRLDLGPGTTLLVGDVGAGKSSLLYAIEMALFGVAEVDAAFLVRHGTAHAEVAVTLQDDEHAYTVRRRFRKVRRRGRETYEPERLTFAQDGRPTAYSATEIRQRVIELLGFPDNPNPHAHSDLWRWAIYVPQERMREILAADPEERLETVRKALGVERYRTAAENAQALAGDLRISTRRRREEAQRMAHWDVEFAEATREADRLRAERLTLVDAVARAEQVLGRARADRRAAEEAVAAAEADRRELESLRTQDADEVRAVADASRRREALLAEIRSATVEAEALQPVVAGRPQVSARLLAAQELARTRRAEVERHAGALQRLARAVAAAEAATRRSSEAEERARATALARDDARRVAETTLEQAPLHEPPCPTARTVADLEQELGSTLVAEHAALETQARARARCDQLEELLTAGVCPTCQQAVRPADFSAHRDEARRELATAEANRARIAATREGLEDERKARERYDRARERWTEVERRREEARAAVAAREAEAGASVQKAAEAHQELEGARAEVEGLRPAEQEGVRLRTALDAAEQEVRELGASEQRSAAAAERLRALRAISERLSAEQLQREAEIEAARRRQQTRGDRLRELEARLGEATTSVAGLDAARRTEGAAEQALADARGAQVRLDTRLDGLVERVALAERGRADRAHLVEEASDLEAKADWVAEPFRFAVLRMEKELLAHAQTAFERAFARFFASLIDDPTLVARTDVSFTPEVTIAGQPTPSEALSGGERTSLALAFRLALASVVRSLGAVRLQTLLLDEPTEGFSAEQVVRMGELLEELALPQVVLVSHESELTGIADRTVRVLKVGGRSVLDAGGSEAAQSAGDAVAGGGPPTEPPASPAPPGRP